MGMTREPCSLKYRQAWVPSRPLAPVMRIFSGTTIYFISGKFRTNYDDFNFEDEELDCRLRYARACKIWEATAFSQRHASSIAVLTLSLVSQPSTDLILSQF